MGIRMGCGHFFKKKLAVYRLTYRKFAKMIIIALNRPWWKDRESVKLNKPMERWSVQYLYLDINRMFNYNTTRHMGKIWAHDQDASPPRVVQIIIDYFGGLNPGQTLFTSDPDQDGLLLCAWWPWGNGKTISIRLGVFADSLNDPDNEELTRRFRGWFDI